MAFFFFPVSSAAPDDALVKSGTEFVTDALRELQVLDPTATAEGEQLEDGLRAGTDLLDTWRVDRLTIGGVTAKTYSLVTSQQDYSIGQGADFDQAYPAKILFWSVIPDRTAANPIEMPRGRPLTAEQWQAVWMKSQTGSYPTDLYFDESFDSNGFGTVKVHPIPDRSTIDINLYQALAVMVSLEATTAYRLRPGARRALTLNLAIELAGRYGKAATMTESLERRASQALASFKRANIRWKEASGRPEFAIGSDGYGRGRAGFNVYNGN
jgi:hypothetical protein